MPDRSADLYPLVLAAAGGLSAEIQAGVRARGFPDTRAAHGFVFVRLAPAGATTVELAEYLGVTKQAAGQLVDELVRRGYVRRGPHPSDARAKLVELTERGWACTRAADAAGAEAIARWVRVLGADRVEALRDDLARVAPPGRIRPVW
jgi:DNA-binding MarR family transcriptional regulator